MVMVLVGVRPWLTGTRTDQSQTGRDLKTPRTTRRVGDHLDGSDKSSRVSSGSTLKTATQRNRQQAKLTRQMTRTSTSYSMKYLFSCIMFIFYLPEVSYCNRIDFCTLRLKNIADGCYVER